MPKPDPEDRQYLDRAIAAWNEYKADYFRSYHAGTNDVKRLWAVALSSDWHGSGISRMERLVTLLPKAIEHAARMPLFGARTTLWTICKEAKGVERLAGGVCPATYEEIVQYDRQVLRVRLSEASLLLVQEIARRKGQLPSVLVGDIVEAWVEQDTTVHWGPDDSEP